MNNLLEKRILNSSIVNTSKIKGIERKVLQNKIQKFVIDGKIIKIKNGLYAMVNPLVNDIYSNKYELATSMFDDAYIVYHTALEYHGLSNQIYNTVQVGTKKAERKIEFNGYTFEFYNNLKSEYIESYYQNSLIRVTSLEQTIVDCLNKIKIAGGIEEVSTAIGGITYIDEKKLLNVLKIYDDKNLYKKVGYILNRINKNLVSKNFYDVCKIKMGNTVGDLRENRKLPSLFDREWNIIVPKYLVNEEF